MSRWIPLVIAATLLPVCAGAAPILLVDVAADAAGYSYTYELESDTTGQEIVELILEGLSTYDDTSVTAPSGWIAAFPFAPDFLVWVAVDPLTTATLGRLVSGFSFQSLLPPGEGTFLALYAEPDAFGDVVGLGSTSVPTAVPPSAVPEPPSVYLILGGGFLLAAWRRRMPTATANARGHEGTQRGGHRVLR